MLTRHCGAPHRPLDFEISLFCQPLVEPLTRVHNTAHPPNSSNTNSRSMSSSSMSAVAAYVTLNSNLPMAGQLRLRWLLRITQDAAALVLPLHVAYLWPGAAPRAGASSSETGA